MNANNEWGLTEKGFRRPGYPELLDAIEYKARELFGAKVNLTVRSPMGKFLRMHAWTLDMLFQILEDIYNSRYIDTAVGTSLYNIGKFIGLQLLPAQRAAGYLLVTGTPGTEVPAGFLAATVSGVQYVAVADTTVGEDGTALVPIRSFYAGPDGNTGADTVTEIVNPQIGITSVTNPKQMEGGRNREQDYEFRERYYKSVDFSGGVNADAIRAELLQSVESIIDALVFENDTDDTDESGLPPHSIEAIVYGGLDSDVAKAIFKRKAAGIQTYGNVAVPVTSASGQIVDISFSRPSPVDIWVKVESLVSDSYFPDDGTDQIIAAVGRYIGTDLTAGLPIGDDVFYNRLPAIVNGVTGVVDYDLSISADGLTYSKENIPIAPREKAVTSASKVVVLR